METFEATRKQYYDHVDYTATYYALYVALEKWMADVVFREDLSRVFLSSPDYAYRRRFELTDTAVAYNKIQPASLRFPFANYWPLNAGWQPDDRIAANPASFVEVGVSAQSRILKAMMVTTDIEALLHFDREDDARQAYERLLWQSYRERYSSTTIAWKGEVLGLPLNIKVKNLEFNPNFTEQDWLKSNRIFIVRCTIGLRSYSLEPPRQLPYNASEDSVLGDDERYYITEEVITNLLQGKRISSTTHVKSLLDYNPTIPINYVRIGKKTQSTAKVEWSVEAPLDSVVISLEGLDEVTLPGSSKSYIFNELTKGSKYVATITFISKEGVSKVTSLDINTDNESGNENVRANKNTLVGTTWGTN